MTDVADRLFEVPACLVVTCAAGRITRLEEYLDSAHVARLTTKE